MAHGGDIRLTEQELLNESYDWLLSLLGVSLWGYDNTPGAIGARRIAVNSEGQIKSVIAETTPTDSTKTNPSTVLSYDVNGDLQYIDETIGATTYRTTLTYVARVLTGISAAVEL